METDLEWMRMSGLGENDAKKKSVRPDQVRSGWYGHRMDKIKMLTIPKTTMGHLHNGMLLGCEKEEKFYLL